MLWTRKGCLGGQREARRRNCSWMICQFRAFVVRGQRPNITVCVGPVPRQSTGACRLLVVSGVLYTFAHRCSRRAWYLALGVRAYSSCSRCASYVRTWIRTLEEEETRGEGRNG